MPDLEPIPANLTDITTTCDNCINAQDTDAVGIDSTDSITLESRHEKILSVFHKYRSDPNFHYIFTMGRPQTSTPTDDDPCTTLPYIQEATESADDWDTSDDSISSIPPTPPPPPTPPVLPSDAPGPSIPVSPPFSPPGNPAITKIKQKFLALFKKL
jgi:hypothetical protein